MDVRSPLSMKLVNANGSDLAPLGALVLQVSVGNIQTNHPFIVVDRPSVSIILGCDFLMRHGVVIDFDHCTVFSPGSGYLLWKFIMMPYGLTELCKDAKGD